MIHNNRLWLGLIRFQRRKEALPRLVQARRDKAERCRCCNATARAMERVRAQWVVAGIDKGEGQG